MTRNKNRNKNHVSITKYFSEISVCGWIFLPALARQISFSPGILTNVAANRSSVLWKCIQNWVHALQLQVSFNSLSGNPLKVIIHFIYFRNNIYFSKIDVDIPIGKHGLQWAAVNSLEMYFNGCNKTRLLLTHCLIYLLQWWHAWSLRNRLKMKMNLMYTGVKFASLFLS